MSKTDLHIANGRLAGVPFKPARASGGPIAPDLIILHDTAGRLEKGSSVAWFQSPECKTSAHIVIEIDGSITQMVPLDRKAFHAGQSAWGGRVFCNSFSIGIEIVNPGRLDADGMSWFKQRFDGSLARATSAHGSGRWLPYTPAQIAAVIAVCRAICRHYPAVNEIVGHHDVSPGRKVDPTPLFPWDHVRHAVLDGEDEAPPQPPPPAANATPAQPITSMAQSSTGNTALGLGAGGGTGVAVEVSGAVAKASSTGEPLSVTSLLLALAQSPTFWIGVFTIAGAAYIWLERRRKLQTWGI